MNKDFESYIMYNVKRLVNLAIKYINESEIESIKPKPRTITSFIRGSVQSPFLNRFIASMRMFVGRFQILDLNQFKLLLMT